MKPTVEDLSLVRRIVGLIDNSKLGKATIVYIEKRLLIPESEHNHVVEVLKKYFKKAGWSPQDYTDYFVPRKDLVLPKPNPEEPPEEPPFGEGEMLPTTCPGTFASHVFDALEREEARLDAERVKDNN